MLLQPSYRFLSRSLFSMLFLVSINFRIAEAQVIPDGTLPTNVEQLEMIRKITGGERSGNNLFHSFEEFAIPAGMEVIFENAADIQNIFTRITGSEASFIDGLLKTAGGANFFLINPNGIIFGENAQLNVGGSFIATTANSIEFADGTTFAARGDEPKVTLTISVPVGLGLYGNNGSITVNGSGNQITRQRFGNTPYLRNRTSGLSVPSGETLALVGKGINFNGGAIITEGGLIEIGSIDVGQVRIDENIEHGGWKIGYEQVTAFENINFNQNALIDPSGGNNSSIAVYGQDITLTDNSILLIQNNEIKPDGAIRVNASDFLEISNNSNITTETVGEVNTSPISISAKNLLIQNSGAIASGTFNLGRGGDINIDVAEKLEIINSATQLLPGGLVTFTADAGNAGNISISTQELQASQGGALSSLNNGNGIGGDINISADLVELNGTTTEENGLFTFIGSVTLGQESADAGKVNLEVSNLRLLNGAAISSDSSSNAASGNININATDSIEVIGIDPNQSVPSSITSSVTGEENEAIRSAFGLPLIPEGNAGDIKINTPILSIAQGGAISVRNEGTGSAGKLGINADNLNLDRSGSITAAASSGLGGEIFLNTQDLNISNDSQITATAGGDGEGGNITITTTNLTAKKNNNITASANLGGGGNITINADNSLSLKDQDEIAATSISADGGNIKLNTEQLQLDNNSQISTSAEGLGNGGNININSNIFTALNNSQVTAKAIKGDGGNIIINTNGYFVSDDFIISASSEFGLDGTITINAPDNNFQKDLELPNYEVVALPDFYLPRCENPDRARLSINLGHYLGEDPDNYFSSPGTLSGEQDLPPDLGEKLEQMGRELESNPTPEAEKESNILWQPGEAILNSTEVVETKDGRIFLVPSEQTSDPDLGCKEQASLQTSLK